MNSVSLGPSRVFIDPPSVRLKSSEEPIQCNIGFTAGLKTAKSASVVMWNSEVLSGHFCKFVAMLFPEYLAGHFKKNAVDPGLLGRQALRALPDLGQESQT